MFDKNFFEKAYKIGMHEVELSECAVFDMETHIIEDDGIKFVFYTYTEDDGGKPQREERVIQFSFDEFMALTIDEIFDRFAVVEEELKEIFYKRY